MSGDTADVMMNASALKRLDAIKLAKASKWEELQQLVESEPATARQLDSYSMLPLHWACTEPHSISESVLMTLLKAYPQGAGCPNAANLAPLQIAIKAQASIEWLQALLAADPQAVLMKTPTGENVAQLARKASLPLQSIRLLEEMYMHVCQKAGIPCDDVFDEQPAATAPTREDAILQKEEEAIAMRGASEGQSIVRTGSMGSTTMRVNSAKVRSYSENDYQMAIPEALPRTTDEVLSYGSNGGMRQSMLQQGVSLAKPLPYQMSAQLSTRTVVSLPPRWTNAPNCHICSSKFGAFRKRHHCRNCGQSICKDHSARERVRLPHYGLPDRYRVCTVCLATLKSAPREMLQPGQTRVTSYAQQQRADDVATRITAASAMSYHLDRHVSAPTRTGPEPDYENMHLKVATLQRKLSQLMEEKEIAETQLKAQAELLGEGYEQRLTGLGRRDISFAEGFQTMNSVSSSEPERSVEGTQQEGGSPGQRVAWQSAQAANAGAEADYPSFASTFKYSETTEPSSINAGVLPGSNRGSGSDKGAASADDDEDDEGDDSHKPEVEVLVNLGLSMMAKDSNSAAVQAFSRAVDICPEDALLYSYLAKAHYADQNLDEAVAALDKSLALEPSAANSTLLGKILFEKGDHERAIEAYQKSLQIQQGKE